MSDHRSPLVSGPSPTSGTRHPTVSNGPTENLNLKIKNTKRIAPRIPQLRPLPPAVPPARSVTDANQDPRSQVRCVEPRFWNPAGSVLMPRNPDVRASYEPVSFDVTS